MHSSKQNRSMVFKSDLKKIGPLDIPQDFDVRRLPQLFRCDRSFIRAQNSEMLNYILSKLPEHPEYDHLSVDSRTHMLFTDVYPNIPGWHCDDFYRTQQTNDQPDLENLTANANSIHYMLLIGDASRTEFLIDDIELPTAREVLSTGTTKPIYFHYDELIEQRNVRTTHLEERTLYSFGPLCFHRGQAAVKNGWRYFIRLTYSNHYAPRNELRYQTQVYTRERISW
jgi:hypothetical protein